MKMQELTAEENDLYHGSSVESLNDILDNGIMCGEIVTGNLDNYNLFGLKLRSAETTFFVDFFEVKRNYDGTTDYVSDADPDYVALPDNDLITLVVKKEHFSFTKQDEARPYDYFEKKTGKLIVQFPCENASHTAVFVGVASTDIAAIIAGGKADLQKLKEILIRKKRYIPIFDCSHRLLFPYEEYQAKTV